MAFIRRFLPAVIAVSALSAAEITTLRAQLLVPTPGVMLVSPFEGNAGSGGGGRVVRAKAAPKAAPLPRQTARRVAKLESVRRLLERARELRKQALMSANRHDRVTRMTLAVSSAKRAFATLERLDRRHGKDVRFRAYSAALSKTVRAELQLAERWHKAVSARTR